MNLKYYMPTRVIVGKGCIRENAALLKDFGAKALIVTGRKSAKINGSLGDILEALRQVNIPHMIYDKIESNPSVESVREAAAIAREHGADFIIGCGGGSPMDAAKAIAILTANNVDDDTLFSNKFANPVLPVVAVPTTAGTGSETTQYSILTYDRLQTKLSIASETIFPKLAFLDARYTEGLPYDVTVNTAIDALSHAMEGYLSVRANPMSSFFAAESMRSIGECLEALKSGDVDFSVREKLLYASMLAGIVIAHTGTTALHSMGYSLTYFRNIDHGRANGLLMYEYLMYIAARHESKVVELLSCLGMKDPAELKALLDSLLRHKESLAEEEIAKFASIAVKAKNIVNTMVKPDEEDLASMIRKSFYKQ